MTNLLHVYEPYRDETTFSRKLQSLQNLLHYAGQAVCILVLMIFREKKTGCVLIGACVLKQLNIYLTFSITSFI